MAPTSRSLDSVLTAVNGGADGEAYPETSYRCLAVSSSASVRKDVVWLTTTEGDANASIERLVSSDGVLRRVERVRWTRSFHSWVP